MKFGLGITLALWLGMLGNCAVAQIGGYGLDPDKPAEALEQLQMARQSLMVKAIGPVMLGEEMLELGMWEDLEKLLAGTRERNPAMQLLKARFAFQQHRFQEAEEILSGLEDRRGAAFQENLLRIDLYLQAWQLADAEQLALSLLKEKPQDSDVLLRLSQLEIFRKNYRKALQLAEQIQAADSLVADAYYLEGEAHIWLRNPVEAEEALRQCLRLNPFHADARFSYGYAIWRRVDATLLDNMALQWEVALAVHPLHYRTHWHWGNGHTNLTYADYVDPHETEIRSELKSAEVLIAEGRVGEALELIHDVSQQYPESVIPDLYAGSAWYMNYSQPDERRLDSAQRIFQEILAKKPHYGPAHNGLAAVIKQRQFPYLVMYDSLEQVIAQTPIGDPESFFHVFPDMDDYPSDRVPKMVWNQLYTGVAYFPFLAKLNRQFVIPPLHRDLALAMDNTYFRGGTTFDNRQWMDIRGVGSGATGIEYVERGAHLERNVTLHEYVHLFHGYVFTDAEMRAVRERYYYAMENGLTLDYYSANNEFEYFAQTFPAYFIPVKVHPLNHKAVNTRSDLEAKDPLMFAFIDSLVRKQQAFLAGDDSAMADNWAEVYRSLAARLGANRPQQALAILDTALMWDSQYLPAFLTYASLLGKSGQFDSASVWLESALALDSTYAPVYREWAELTSLELEQGTMAMQEALAKGEEWLKLALGYEKDYDQQAQLAQALMELYIRHAQWDQVVETAEGYALVAPQVSTYLRDRRDEALAVAALHRGLLGYEEMSLEFLADLVERKPQHYHHREQFAAVLLSLGKGEEALSSLVEAQRILEAAGNPSETFDRQIAEAQLIMGDTLAARRTAQNYLVHTLPTRNLPDWGLLALRLGFMDPLKREFEEQDESAFTYPGEGADLDFLKGEYALVQGDSVIAEEAFREAIQKNIYHLPARFALLDLLKSDGQIDEVRRIATEGTLLPLPPGPVMMRRLEAYLEE